MIEDEIDRLADAVHADGVRSLAAALGSATTTRMPLRPAPEVPSYFTPPARARMAAADFELAIGDSATDFIAALRLHWSTAQPELTPLADGLRGLAALMARADVGQSAEISAFTYVMY